MLILLREILGNEIHVFNWIVVDFICEQVVAGLDY